MIKIFKFCKPYLKDHRHMLLCYIVLCIVSSVLSLGIPYISGNFIDYLVTSSNKNFIANYCWLFCILSISGIVLGYITNRINIILQTKLGYDLNRDSISHLQSLSLSFFQDKDLAYITQRVNNDSNALMTFCTSVIQNLLMNFVALIASVALLSWFNPIIATLMCGLAIVYLITFVVLKKPLFEKSYMFKEAQSEYFGKLYEQLSHIEFLKLQAICNIFLSRLKYAIKDLLEKAMKFQTISYLFSGIDSFIVTLANIVLFWLGGVAVVNKSLTIGQFTIISSYFMVMIRSMRYFFNLGKTIQDNIVSYERLKEIWNTKSESNGVKKALNISNISTINMSFSYPKRKIFENISLDFDKGNIYAFVGANGTGKSTLIKLLVGLYIDEMNGDIKFNGISIRDIDMYYLRQNIIGISEQEPSLLEESIEFNIFLGNSTLKIPSASLYKLIDMLGLEDFFEKLPNGFDTRLDEKVKNISGGEKQKLSLLRVLVKDSPIMIFDEPTSALDAESKQRFIQYILSIKRNKIIIVATHDQELYSIADRCLMFPMM